MVESFDKKIEYWAKHQGLDISNYNHATHVHLSFMAIIVVIYFSAFSLLFALNAFDYIFYLTLITIILGGWISRDTKKKLDWCNEYFMAREEMIRYWYGNLKNNKVDTDKLDELCEEIREILKKYKGKKLREEVKKNNGR